MTCPICGSHLERMGILGKLLWLRCKGCGAEMHVEVDDVLAEEPEEREFDE